MSYFSLSVLYLFRIKSLGCTTYMIKNVAFYMFCQMPNRKNKEERLGLKELVDFLDKCKAKSADKEMNVLLVPHLITDTDGAASAFTMAKVITSLLGEHPANTQVILDDSRTPDLQKVLDEGRYQHEFKFTTLSEYDLNLKPDIIVYVDCQPEPERTALPKSLDISKCETIVIDHHEKKKSCTLEFIADEYKSNIAWIYDLFLNNADIDFEFTPGLAAMCAQATKRDTDNFNYSSDRDCEVFKEIMSHLHKDDLSLLLSLDDLLLTQTQLQTYASGLAHSYTIENLCKFSLIPGVITGDEHVAMALCAEFLLNQTKPADISNSIVAAIESNDQNERFVSISIRGEECRKIAEVFGGSGRKDMAGAQIPVPYALDKALKTPYFMKLVEEELNARILGSYLNKSDTKPEPKKVLEETTKKPLEEKLRDAELTQNDMVLLARGHEYVSARNNIVSYFMHTEPNKPYGGSISEDQLGLLANLLHQFEKVKDNSVSVVYALVNSPAEMCVYGLVSSKDSVKHNAKYVATEVFGTKSIQEKLSRDNFVVVKIDLNMFKYAWGNDNLSKCVYIAVEEKLEEMFNQDKQFETIYLQWKKEHAW
jgi:nanoRNase/pAp phosphatase (c-di-AMP/oligoRNAs hydrolase)